MNTNPVPTKFKKCQYCAHYARRGLYHVCTRETWLSVALPYLFPSVPRVVVPNAPACGWFRLAPHQILPQEKKWCGFFETSVSISDYNQHGACKCLGCTTGHCAICDTHAQHFDWLVDSERVYRYRLCKKCLERQK